MSIDADLDAARRDGSTIPTRRGTLDELGLERAYEIGRDLERRRIAGGWRPVGWKLGFTNQALWQRLGLDRPIRARLYEQTLCTGELDLTELVDPRIEPEIVVGFARAVPEGSPPDVIAGAVGWVAAGIEVVHCHFTGWELTPAEAVADGGLHAALAVGPRTPAHPDALRALDTARSQLRCDGTLLETGSGADVLGGPVAALEWLLAELPGGVRAGEVVTTGTLTPALPIAPGQHWEHRLDAGVRIAPVSLRLVGSAG